MHASPMDALRGVSAQVVFLAHALAFPFPALIGGLWGGLRAMLAQLAVVTFFTLSGFVIASSLKARTGNGQFDLGAFVIRRVARIWPPYVVSLCIVGGLLLMIAAGNPVTAYGRALIAADTSPRAWLVALGLVSSAGENLASMFNSPVWSLRLEVRLYVLAGLAAVAWVAHGALRWLAVGALAFLAYRLCRQSFGLSSMLIFASGAAAALLADRVSGQRAVGLAVAGGVALLLLVGPVGWREIAAPSSQALQCLYGAALALALPSLRHPLAATAYRSTRLLCASGNYSYTLYIVHFPLLLALNAAFGIATAWQALVAVVGVNAACWAIARFAERTDVYAALLRAASPAGLRRALVFRGAPVAP